MSSSGTRHRSVHRDVVVIGSGFGGAMAAWPLVHRGADVLMIERGPWVERGPGSWAPDGTLTRTPYYDGDRYRARTDRGEAETGVCSCVGGASVFYGAVSLRFREADFRPDPEIVGDSGARWPLSYDDLRPCYREAERILRVAGEVGRDPTEPRRRGGFPQSPPPLSPVSSVIAAAASARGLRPFRLPLAIEYDGRRAQRAASDTGAAQDGGPAESAGGGACVECGTCDTFACAVGAKNDLAARVLPPLLARGLELRTETAVTRLRREGERIASAECLDRRTGERWTVTADTFVLAAGALGSPHLLLASGLHERNPAGDAVGRYLVRHCSAIVFGGYPWIPRHEGRFHKQVGINDYYFGDPGAAAAPTGKLGHIQQTQTPSMGTVRAETGALAAALLAPLVRRATGLLVIAEDRPRYENRVHLDPSSRDDTGLPRLRIEHRYDARDLEARSALADRARQIHRAAGALACYVHEIDTFSHALGTVRMGADPVRSPLDSDGRFRGLENLYVTDGSALPTAAAVNPSLTIAANALRVGHSLARPATRSAAAGTLRGR